MRESPRKDSKVVSQVLFSEQIIIQEERGDWSLILTPDHYSGWVKTNTFVKLEKAYQPSMQVVRLAAHLYGMRDTEYGPLKTVPYGVKLQVLDATDSRWMTIALPDGTVCYIQKGDVGPLARLENKKELIELGQRFLGLPYTWGGRSSFGYDCSGFVQMLYQQIGIHLPRDARDQILDPRARIIAMNDLKPCDLIFFGKSEQDIRHVGMYLEGGRMIHSSAREGKPWLRISSLSDAEWSGAKNVYYPFRSACHWPVPLK
jgi:hypothetical protein